MSDEPAAVMHIGEVAARTDLSLRTLRHYDEVGLLRPSGRSEGGFRLYTEADVDRILVIRRMKPLGFTLEQMAEVLRDIETLQAGVGGSEGGSEDDAVRSEARARLDGIQGEAHDRRARLARQLAMADEFIDLLAAHRPDGVRRPTPDPAPDPA